MADDASNVALIVHPTAGDGRSDQVLLQTVLALRESGWRVVVALPESGALSERLRAGGVQVETVAAPVMRKRDLGVRGVAGFLRRSLSSVPRLETVLRHVRPDVVVVSTMTQPVWILAARLRHIPVLAYVQELDTDSPLLVREAIARPLLLADRVLVDSTATQDALAVVLPSLAARSVVLPTGIDAPRTVVPPRERPTGGMRICCVARIEPGSGVRAVVEAFALLLGDGADARLDIAALTIDEGSLSRLRVQLARLDVEDLVTVRPVTGDLWDVLEAADVAVVPSRAETSFGGTAAEAVLAGRPVIVTTTKGLADATDGFTSALPIDADDPFELARALRRIETHWTAFRRSALALAPVAARRFSPSAYRAAFAAEVRSLVRSTPDRHHLLAA